MKALRNILIPIFFIVTVSVYWGLELVEHSNHLKNKIETAAQSGSSRGVVTSEFGFDDDVIVSVSNNNSLVIKVCCEPISAIFLQIPHNLYRPIWQPPRVS